eukprot:jgi/Botrbrau1/936/Bobra.0167s0047.1
MQAGMEACCLSRQGPPSGATPQFFGESAEDPKKAGLPKIDLSKMDLSKVDLSKIPKVQLDDQQKAALQDVLDTSTLGKRGEGWVLAGLVTFGLIIFPPRGIEVFVQCLGLGLALYGAFQWFFGMTNIGIANISPFATPRKNNRLTTTGIYKYVRHPQYGGTLLIAFGLAIATGDAARFALATLLLFLIEEKVKLEEASLKLAHPEVYEEYLTTKPKPQKYIPIFY